MSASRPPRTSQLPRSNHERATVRYEVREELAVGGMGIVHRVFDRFSGEERALKRISPESASQPFLIEAFEREYQVLAGLDHPRIIRVFDYDVDEAGPYYTMELLEGRDMREAAPLPYREACRYLRDVAASLALLHVRRLIHRDVSPGNVRLTPDGHCKLLDFGALAAFGNSRLVVGTPPTIAPEALEGAPLDQRTDLYSLGALAYWMLTKRHAYPARNAEDLPEIWKETPPAPSALVDGIPKELDGLVLSLLSDDPLARPASAGEVIARLNFIGELGPEDGGEAERQAQSFLLSPRFVGHATELAELNGRIAAVIRGRGAAVRIEAVAGMGRTRLLEEIGVRAQIAGAAVLRLDASVYRHSNGTARALAVRLLDALPTVARESARRHRTALAQLGREVEARVVSATTSQPPPAMVSAEADAGASLEGWFAEVSRAKPLVIEVDNVDDADDASLGLLVALARIAEDHPLVLVVTERVRRDPRTAAGLVSLRERCRCIALSGLSPAETLELTRSMFGDAPNLGRFAEWLYVRTAGSPLHCVEISRQLVTRQVIRYLGGLWVLPVDRPDAELPAALEDALSIRLATLSDPARGLAECLSLQREQATPELCRLLVEDGDDRRASRLLDELARTGILYADEGGYRFGGMALREALLSGMDEARREQNHRRLGEAFLQLAQERAHALRIEAGWHLIQGGDGLRGADLIAEVTRGRNSPLIANLNRFGRPIEAALKVYKWHRRSSYECMPLLAALALAGYYEDRFWGEQYGDEALDVCEDLSGVRTARRLRRILGRWPAMALGLLSALLRFYFTPRRERNYAFPTILVQLFQVVTTLSGMAALSFDAERATRVAGTVELFARLPARLAPVGVYKFCVSLGELGREHLAETFAAFDNLLRRFEDPRYYPGLPSDVRLLLANGAHFARGLLAAYRDDGRAALESADALEASGFRLYAMIASQLRFLYYTNRGEIAKASKHRERVELHAAHVGSAWQVETWEPFLLVQVYANMADLVGLTQVADRLEMLSKSVPSLKLYGRLAKMAVRNIRGDSPSDTESALSAELATRPPKSFVGWASSFGFMAQAFNEHGKHAEAKAFCERALPHITDADREYVIEFLNVDVQMAVATAGLGQVADALARIDGLLGRFQGSDHPLAMGLLHEARARISWRAGRMEEFAHSLTLVNHWFRQTGTPALIAKCERLAELQGGVVSAGGVSDASAASERDPLRTGVRDAATVVVAGASVRRT